MTVVDDGCRNGGGRARELALLWTLSSLHSLHLYSSYCISFKHVTCT